MTTYFTSDLHFGHRAIIKYCNRPFVMDGAPANWMELENWKDFVDVFTMNRVIVERWNETVHPSDTVWVLGDFAWTGYESIFHQLRGNKHLITGNHDSQAVVALPWSSQPVGYQALNGEFEPIKYGKRPAVILSHYAMRTWHGKEKGSIMLYGHSHNGLPGFRVPPNPERKDHGGGSLDVGVDCWDFRPVSLEQIKARLETLPELS